MSKSVTIGLCLGASLPNKYQNGSVSQLKFPVYKSDDGSIIWFPRIIGGEPAQLGDFRGKVKTTKKMKYKFNMLN